MAYINNTRDIIDILGELRGAGKKYELGNNDRNMNLANRYVNDVWDINSWLENRLNISADPKLKEIMDNVMNLRSEAKKLETDIENYNNPTFSNKVVNTLYELMLYVAQNIHEIHLKDAEYREKMDTSTSKYGR